MSDRNDVVILNLDRPREVRFGHKALKTLCAMTGVTMDKIGGVLNMATMEDVETLMYCGLLSDAKKNNEIIKLEEMEDLLDMVPFEDVMETLTKAFASSLGDDEPGEEQKNEKGTAKNPKK
jgi:hypothetical protein